MAEYDLSSEVKAVMALEADAYAAVAAGPNIDTLGFESAVFVVHSGTLGTGTIDFLLEEADDNGSGSPSTFTTVVAGDIVGSIPTILATEDDKVWRFGYNGKKRWLRLTNIETATWTSMIHGAVALLGNPEVKPVAFQIT